MKVPNPLKPYWRSIIDSYDAIAGVQVEEIEAQPATTVLSTQMAAFTAESLEVAVLDMACLYPLTCLTPFLYLPTI